MATLEMHRKHNKSDSGKAVEKSVELFVSWWVDDLSS